MATTILNLIVLIHAAHAQPIRALTLNGSLSSGVTKINFIPVNGLNRVRMPN